MCYHKSTPVKQDLKEYLDKQQVEVELPEFDFYYHAIGFNHPQVPILTMEEPHKVQTSMWGLVPFFAKDKKDAQGWAAKMLNATCEKMDSTYKPYFKTQRCLIFVNGFYEWQWRNGGKDKVPFYIYREGGTPFTMGGIYNNWTDRETGEVFATYSVVTTPANTLMAEIHNNKKRMPLIIGDDQWGTWLGPEPPKELLQPYHDDFLRAHEISRNITKRGFYSNVLETQAPINSGPPSDALF